MELLHWREVVGGGLALGSTTGWTLGDKQHAVSDEGLELLLPEPGVGSEPHGLGDGLEPLHGAISEEGILGVRGRHAGVVYL